MTTPTEAEPTYLFGPRDRQAILLGMRAPQLVLLSLGAVSLLLGLLSQSRYGVPAGLTAGLAAVCVALVPVQGRPLVDWARPVVNFLYGRFTGQGTYLGGPWARTE